MELNVPQRVYDLTLALAGEAGRFHVQPAVGAPFIVEATPGNSITRRRPTSHLLSDYRLQPIISS